MPGKIVIHLFHADENSLGTGSHVAARIRQVSEERNAALEVYVFGPAERALGDPARSEFRDALIELANAKVPVHTCRSIAEEMDRTDEFIGLGFTLEYARDAFIRYAHEGAAIISF